MCINDRIDAVQAELDEHIFEVAKDLVHRHDRGLLPEGSRILSLAKTLHPDISSSNNAIQIVIAMANNLAMRRLADMKIIN